MLDGMPVHYKAPYTRIIIPMTHLFRLTSMFIQRWEEAGEPKENPDGHEDSTQSVTCMSSDSNHGSALLMEMNWI